MLCFFFFFSVLYFLEGGCVSFFVLLFIAKLSLVLLCLMVHYVLCFMICYAFCYAVLVCFVVFLFCIFEVKYYFE